MLHPRNTNGHALAPPDLSCEPNEVWYLAYDGCMHPDTFKKRIGYEPLERQTIRCEDAYLSWDFRGIPYVEPCYVSLVVKGVNDLDVTFGGEAKSGSNKYAIWQRCAPGVPYNGHAPPCLEAVAYKITVAQWNSIRKTEGYRDVRLPRCSAFNDGVIDNPVGELSCVALMAEPGSCKSGGMQPSVQYHRSVHVAANLSVLSQAYLSHLTLIRPYDVSALPLFHRFGAYLFRFLFFLPYLFIIFPLCVVKPNIIGKGQWDTEIAARTVAIVWVLAGWTEKLLFAPLFGSGFYMP